MDLHEFNEAKYHWDMQQLYIYGINNDISMNNFIPLVM